MKVKLDIIKLILIVFCLLEFLFFSIETPSQEGNPLPLSASWENGSNNNLTGYSPEWQIDMIEKGHHILLNFGYDYFLADWFVNSYLDDYYRIPIEKASKYGIPIAIKTTQPEATLNIDPWFSLPMEDNPNVVESDGTVQRKVSPCGPIEHWPTVGEGWINPNILTNAGYTESRNWWTNPILSQLQNWYPDPPFVIWLSNNEASKVRYGDVDDDYRFQDAYSGDPDYDTWQFRNEIIGGNTDLTNPEAGGYETDHGYIPRYNAMFDGMRNQLVAWSNKIKFVGYENNLSCFARWTGWVGYIPAPIPGRFSTIPHIWDGASQAYYVNEWQGNWDFTGYAPQLEAMNLPFQEDYYSGVKSEFWWEISTWFDPEFIERFEGEGQEVTPERYEGYIKWSMWLTKPRAVRDFKYSTETREDTWEWYKPIVDAVDEIHVNSTLEQFWRYSEPVLLTSIPHPWRDRDEFWPELFYSGNERMRWYQLPNNITYTPNSSDDWSTINDRIYAVWIMANVMGTSPEREWLIYAHATLDSAVEVLAQLPEYGDINLTAKRGGTYYLVRESGSDEYIETEPGVRAAEFDDIELEEGEVHRFNGVYSTAYKCNITNYSWDFDDGTTSDSIVVNHSFSEAGTYQVQLTVTSDNEEINSSTMKVTVGKTGGIVINEINYNSSDQFNSGDWVELYNNSKQSIDISGWIFTDSDPQYAFIFTAGTILASDQYIVLVEDSSLFTACFPDVNNFVGQMDFDFSDSGEFMKLTDGEGVGIDSLTYDDQSPWPTEPDGDGATLELADPASDNELGENWKASTDHGSPGAKNSAATAVEEINRKIIPDKYILLQNYPNPFNPATTISYGIPKAGHVALKVFDILGREVAVLVDENKSAGNYQTMWNASGITTGIYFYRLQSGSFTETKKLVLMK